VSKARSVLSNSLLALLGILGTLLIAEGLAGVFWEAPWYEHLFTEQYKAQTYPYVRNSLGLRGPEPELPKPARVRRVLVVGDSFTFGLGVEDDEAPFPAIMARELAGSSPPIEIVNGGIPGSLTADWVALWRRAGEALDPDVVVAVFFLRDGTTLGTIPHFFEQIRRDITRRNGESKLYEYSHLYRRLRDFQDRSRIADLFTESLVDAYLGEDTAEWQRAQANLLQLRELVRAHGAAFGLVVFPVLVELEDDYPFQSVMDELMGFAQRSGIPAHSLLPAFQGRHGPDLWVSAFDQHPNADGHSLAAESMLPFVRELLESADDAAELSPSRS